MNDIIYYDSDYLSRVKKESLNSKFGCDKLALLDNSIINCIMTVGVLIMMLLYGDWLGGTGVYGYLRHHA
jgi:hypothetical protein